VGGYIIDIQANDQPCTSHAILPQVMDLYSLKRKTFVSIVRISAYTNQSRVSHSVRMREKVLRCTLSSLAWSGAS